MQPASFRARIQNLISWRNTRRPQLSGLLCLLALLLILGCSPTDDPAAPESTPGTDENAQATVLTLFGNDVEIDGGAPPDAENHTDFGRIAQGQDALVRHFTVRNDGNHPLTLDSIHVPDGFILLQAPSSAVDPGDVAVFAVQMATETPGISSGEIRIVSNDPQQNPFAFPIRGEVTERAASLTFLGNGIEILPGTPAHSAYHTDFGTVPVRQEADLHIFTVRNDGEAPLELDPVRVPEGFQIVFPPDRTLLPGTDTIFYVRLDTARTGAHAGDIRIDASGDASGSFAFPIQGIVTNTIPIAVFGNGETIQNRNVNLTTDNHTYFVDDSSGLPIVDIRFLENNLDSQRILHAIRWDAGSDSGTATGIFGLPGSSLGHWGSAQPDSTVVRTFHIRNQGDRPLHLDDVDVPEGFVVVSEPASPLEPGQSTSFQVRLDTAQMGLKVGMLSIAGDDITHVPFTFAIMGIVAAPQAQQDGASPPAVPGADPLSSSPRVNVFGDDRNIFNRSTNPNPGDLTDFGATIPGGTPAVRTFTIRNTGDAPLIVEPVIVPEGFTVLRQPESPIAPGDTTRFEVQLDPAAVGAKSGTIAFQHNASNLNPFTFSIRGLVRESSPVIAVSDQESGPVGGTLSGFDAHTDFGTVLQGSQPSVRRFTVRNDGEEPLHLQSVHVPDGFTLARETEATLLPGESTEFQVQLDSEILGSKSGTLRIVSNDPNQGVLVHSIQGAVAESGPVLTVLGNGIPISAGSPIPQANNHTRFVSQFPGQTPPPTHTFTLRNDGTLPLAIDSVSVPAGFALVSQPSRAIDPGATTTFQVQMDNSAAGIRSGAIAIVSNDGRYVPFAFFVRGEVNLQPPANPARFAVLGNRLEIRNLSTAALDTNHTDFGSHTQDSDPSLTTRTFTIRNDGDGTSANFSLGPFFAGGDSPLVLGTVHVPAGFVLVRAPAGILYRGESTSFEVQLDTSQPGAHAGAIFFTHDGRAQSPFAFSIEGTVEP